MGPCIHAHIDAAGIFCRMSLGGPPMPDHRGFAAAIALYFPFVVLMTVLVWGPVMTLVVLAALASAFLARRLRLPPSAGLGA